MPGGRNGWADILGGSQDLAGSPEDTADRTDPNLTPPEFEPAQESPHTQRRSHSAVENDPVLAAMAELDGIQNIPDAALSAASATTRSPTPRVGTNALEDAPAETAPRPSLALPSPTDVARTKPMATAAPIVDDDDAFADLESPTTDSRVRNLEADGIWATYKEVIVASVVGLLLLTAAVIYSTTDSRTPTVETVVIEPKMVPPPKPVPPKPTPPPVTNVEPKKPPKAATPMLTIVSIPSGALVEVNGVVYGKSPLIIPAPRDLSTLVVQLKLNGHKKWSKQIKPNEAGHFSERVELTPLR